MPEALKCDLRMEMEAIPLLREAIAHCESCDDYISRELLEDILDGEEEHVDWLETQIELIAKVGLQNYCSLRCDPTGPAPGTATPLPAVLCNAMTRRALPCWCASLLFAGCAAKRRA